MEWAEHAKLSCIFETNDRNNAAECDRKIQYAFPLCQGSEHTAWLTSIWRSICCNNIRDPIRPQGYAAQDAEMLLQQPTTQPEGQEQIQQGISDKELVLFRITLQVWTDRNPGKYYILNMFLLVLPHKDMDYSRYHIVDKDRLWVGKNTCIHINTQTEHRTHTHKHPLIRTHEQKSSSM